MITKEELEKRLSAFKEQLLKECSPTQFEVGKWDFFTDGKNEWIAKYEKHKNDEYYYSVLCVLKKVNDAFRNTWYQKDWTSMCYYKRPATESEIKQALIKEAERKYKIGDCVKNINGVIGTIGNEFSQIQFTKYFSGTDDLTYLGCNVYRQGKWAEIIKDEKIEIGGHPVVFGSGYIEIKGVIYNKTEIEYLKKIMDKGQVQSLNTGCSGQYLATLEIINKIFDKLK